MPGEAWYEGAHSLTFSDGTKDGRGFLTGFNTWGTWHLIPTSKPIVAAPQPKTNYVEIPGRDGAIDFSTFLTGEIVYGQRSGSWEFVQDNGWQPWNVAWLDIFHKLHGKEFYVVLEDDPEFYYSGRLSINEFRSDASNNRITIDYVLDAYKKSIRGAWKWDPFNFETDIAYPGEGEML